MSQMNERRMKSKTWCQNRRYDRFSKMNDLALPIQEAGGCILNEEAVVFPGVYGKEMYVSRYIEMMTKYVHENYGDEIDTSHWELQRFMNVWRPGSWNKYCWLEKMEAEGWIEIDFDAVQAYHDDDVIPMMFRCVKPPGYVDLGIDVSLIEPRRLAREARWVIEHAEFVARNEQTKIRWAAEAASKEEYNQRKREIPICNIQLHTYAHAAQMYL